MSIPWVWIAGTGFAILITLSILIYTMPSELVPKKKKEKAAPIPPQKDWESIALRWEKNNQSLLQEIEALKQETRKANVRIEEMNHEKKELLEKLGLEKKWREKEEETLEKVKKKDDQLKAELEKTQQDLEREHALRLRLDRETQQAQIDLKTLTGEKRELAAKVMTLEANQDRLQKDLRDVKRTNEELSQKREDTQWVARSDFEELKKTVSQKEKELTRLQEQMNQTDGDKS